jgi:hypothetical protein
LLPLLLPMVVYVIWAWFARRRQAAGDPPLRLRDGPWFWLIVAGLVLAGGVLVYTALTRGEEAGGVYTAPRWEDGRIVPGRIE